MTSDGAGKTASRRWLPAWLRLRSPHTIGTGAHEEDISRYERSRVDVVHLLGAFVIVAIMLGLALGFESGLMAFEDDLIELLDRIPGAVTRLLHDALEWFALASALAACIVGLVTRRLRLLGYVVVACGLAWGLMALIAWVIRVPAHDPTAAGADNPVGTLSGADGIAAWVGGFTVLAPVLSRRWRIAGIVALVIAGAPQSAGDASAEWRVAATYHLDRTFPSAAESRRMTWRALGLPFRNPSFLAASAVLQLLLLACIQFGLRARTRASLDVVAPRWSLTDVISGAWRTPFSVAVVAVVLALLVGFAKPPRSMIDEPARTAARVGMGVVHTAMQLGAAGLVTWLGIRVVGSLEGWLFTAALTLFVGAVGALVAGLVFGLYLCLATWLVRTHENETFSAMRAGGYKGFLRLRLTKDGAVTIYALGIRRTVRDWVPDPANPDPEAPHLRPAADGAVVVELIDHVELPPLPAGPENSSSAQ